MSGYFIVNEKLPSLNEVLNKNRANRYAGASLKKQVDETICLYIRHAMAKGYLKPMNETPCVVFINWYEKTKKRDVDNIQSSQKFILDALQKCGVIKRDSRKYVKQIFHAVLDGDYDHVIVRLQEDEA